MSKKVMSSQGHENAIHFFKVILPSSLQNKELRIPRSFVRKYWKGQSNSKAVVLRVPDGAEWEVDWIERDGDVWFKNGWKKFADFYSIVDGHFLVFRYEGGYKFEVMIFGMSALEIEYPNCVRGKNIDDDDGHGDDVCEVVKLEEESDDEDDDDESDHQRSRSPLNHSRQPRKKMKTKSYLYSNGTNTNHTKAIGSDAIRRRIMSTRKCSNPEGSKVKVPSSTLKDNESSRALERAKKFHSEKPFFIGRMHPTYVHRSFMLVPRLFSVTYMKGMEGTASIRVCGEMKRSWEVNYKYNLTTKVVIFTSGWSSFVKDNDLEEGDVCVFEMVRHHRAQPQLSFKVVIFRSSTSQH